MTPVVIYNPIIDEISIATEALELWWRISSGWFIVGDL